MTEEVKKIVDLTEQTLLLKPEWQRKIAVSLLNLLRIRRDATYEAALDILAQSAGKIQKNPEQEVAATLLFSEVEIASAFPRLTASEASETESYFWNLLLKHKDSLSAYLADKLNARIGDYWNINDFSDMRMKEFALACSMENANDEAREEDFMLKVSQPVSHKDLFLLVRAHYLSRGYQILNQIGDDCFIKAKKDDKYIVVVITEGGKEILVTVNVIRI